jgi:hypothetical protein
VTHRPSTPTPSVKEFLMNFIWPTLWDWDLHHLCVWRVRTDFSDDQKMFYTNFSPAEMHRQGQRCNGLIELTANALSDDVVVLMLLAVQKEHDLELSIKHAVTK